MLEIASIYFEVVEQSLAHKKARLLVLNKPRPIEKEQLTHAIPHTLISGREVDLVQYYGVFSAKHIDYATQFLLSRLEVDASIKTVLDLASGNGVIGLNIIDLIPNAELHLLDDSQLAVASSRINLSAYDVEHHYNVLKYEGRFVCVANLHLNYQTHLKKIFDQVDVVDMNAKFVVYECWK